MLWKHLLLFLPSLLQSHVTKNWPEVCFLDSQNLNILILISSVKFGLAKPKLIHQKFGIIRLFIRLLIDTVLLCIYYICKIYSYYYLIACNSVLISILKKCYKVSFLAPASLLLSCSSKTWNIWSLCDILHFVILYSSWSAPRSSFFKAFTELHKQCILSSPKNTRFQNRLFLSYLSRLIHCMYHTSFRVTAFIFLSFSLSSLVTVLSECY